MTLPRARLAAALLLLTACDEAPPRSTRLDGLSAALHRFASCAEAESAIEDRVLAQVNGGLDLQLDRLLTGSNAGGIGGIQGGAGGAWGGAGGGGMAGTPAVGDLPRGFGDYGTPTTTVANGTAGSDQPDIVKVDGPRVFVLRGSRLQVVQSWPLEALALHADLRLGGQPLEMFLDDKGRAVVISQVNLYGDGKGGGWGAGGGNGRGGFGGQRSMGGAPGGDQADAAHDPNDTDGSVDGGLPVLPDEGLVDFSSGGASGIEEGVGGMGGGSPTAAGGGSAGNAGGWGGGSAGAGGQEPCDLDGCGDVVSTKVTVVEVGAHGLTVVGDAYLPGRYRGSRRIGSTALVVVDRMFRPLWEGVRHFVEVDDRLSADRPRLEEAFRAAKEENEIFIRSRPLSYWLPEEPLRLADGRPVDAQVQCQELQVGGAPESLSYLTVGSVDLDQPGRRLARTTVLAGAQAVYSTAGALYIASATEGGDQRRWGGQTVLHKFDTSQPGRLSHLASGTLEGTVLGQSLLDEHQGSLRVATSRFNLDGPRRWQRDNRIVVLGQQGNALEVVGQTEALAADEHQSQKVVFQGPRGYLFTSREGVPLQTFDLADPHQPRPAAALPGTGWSTYLHPLGAQHLLAIDLTMDDSGRPRAPRLTIFDLTNLDRPLERHTLILEPEGGASAGVFDHRAFAFAPGKDLFALPITSVIPTVRGGRVSYQVQVLQIDALRGFTRRGALVMDDLVAQPYHPGDWTNGVERSLVTSAGNGDDVLYGLAAGGLRLAPIRDLPTASGTVRFTQ